MLRHVRKIYMHEDHDGLPLISMQSYQFRNYNNILELINNNLSMGTRKDNSYSQKAYPRGNH